MSQRRTDLSRWKNEPFKNFMMDLTQSLRTPEYDNLVKIASDVGKTAGIGPEDLRLSFEAPDKRYSHGHRVGRFAKAAAGELGEPPGIQEQYYWGGYLHDFGKRFEDTFTWGPEAKQLDRKELMMLVRTHAPLGGIVLDELKPIVPLAAAFAWEHAECIDGKGYPKGLAYEELSTPGRVAWLADIYDASITRAKDVKPRDALEDVCGVYSETGRPNDPVVQAFRRVVNANLGKWYPRFAKHES